MSDTIELLEAIGRDASLRRASPEEVDARLARAHASEGLRVAAASGDTSRLFAELGQRPMYAPQATQTIHEEEELEPGAEEDQPPLPAPEPALP